MGKFIKLNKKLKVEIDEIISKHSLVELLKRYGDVHITGSYVYDLMAWKDFDIVLKLHKYNKDEIYELVKELGVKINPQRIRILDNLNKTEANRPEGVWIGLYVDDWKIDIWLMNSENFNKEVQITKDLAEKLKNTDKEILISIKSVLSKDPDYHVKFSSVDLYDAYLRGNVRTVEEFYDLLEIKSKNM